MTNKPIPNIPPTTVQLGTMHTNIVRYDVNSEEKTTEAFVVHDNGYDPNPPIGIFTSFKRALKVAILLENKQDNPQNGFLVLNYTLDEDILEENYVDRLTASVLLSIDHVNKTQYLKVSIENRYKCVGISTLVFEIADECGFEINEINRNDKRITYNLTKG